MIELLAIAAIAVVFYAYLLFPLILFARGWLLPRPWKRGDRLPAIDLIIVCHNEADHIGGKLASVLQLDYPPELLRVIVASDGSDDGTEQIVRDFHSSAVTLLCLPRRGKIPALNDAVAVAQGEVLVFSDANSQFATDALRKLVRHFADEQVGCVAGNQVYTRDRQAGAAGAGERSYWGFDRLLKQVQSRAGNAISATGAIYAIRRELFRTVPSGVTDDFTISTGVIAQGRRLVFDPEAVAREPVAGKPRAEFHRKVRVMTRGLRAVWVARQLLNPWRHGFYSLQLLSHKVLRRLVAFPLLLLLALSPWMWLAGSWQSLLAVGQWSFYGLAALGWLGRNSAAGHWRLFAIPLYFCLVNLAAVVATANLLRGRTIERWDSQRAPADEQMEPVSSAATR